jgi:hypothetical protein
MYEKLRNGVFFVLMALLFSACSSVTPSPTPQKSLFVVWKSPSLRYADQGFLYVKPGKLKFEVYASGQPALNISITSSQICTGLLCMSKKRFNAKYLSKYYPDNILENILTGKAIFGGKNLKKSGEGFSQQIIDKSYSINYRVKDGYIDFIDKKSNVAIKIKNQ